MSAPGSGPRLVATCWTTSGARPLDDPETSTRRIDERVGAVAAGGWYGMGIAGADLAAIVRGPGLGHVRSLVGEAGLGHVEVELLTGWWGEESSWRPTWELLLAAAEAFGSPVVKVGADHGPGAGDVAPFVAPLRRLAEEAAAHGTAVSLEPMPFSRIATVPAGADLVRRVDHPAAGLTVDAWHVFRASTSLEDLARALTDVPVLQAELCDADAAVVGTLFDDTRDRRRLPGRGAQDVVGLVDVLRAAGFDGPWGVEMLAADFRELDLAEGLHRARAAACAVLAR